jgi:hypothetical protein
MNKKAEPGVDFTDEVGRERLRIGSVVAARRDVLERALARLAELAPDLVVPRTEFRFSSTGFVARVRVEFWEFKASAAPAAAELVRL